MIIGTKEYGTTPSHKAFRDFWIYVTFADRENLALRGMRLRVMHNMVTENSSEKYAQTAYYEAIAHRALRKLNGKTAKHARIDLAFSLAMKHGVRSDVADSIFCVDSGIPFKYLVAGDYCPLNENSRPYYIIHKLCGHRISPRESGVRDIVEKTPTKCSHPDCLAVHDYSLRKGPEVDLAKKMRVTTFFPHPNAIAECRSPAELYDLYLCKYVKFKANLIKRVSEKFNCTLEQKLEESHVSSK